MASLTRPGPISPVITGALLFALTRAPASIKQPLLRHLNKYLSPKAIAWLITLLKWDFALGLTRSANSLLNAWSLNRFRIRSQRHKYDWPREVAVVTGGSSGFGALISKDLANHEVKVVVLDVNALPDDMANNPHIVFYQCDITSRETVRDIAGQIRHNHGHPSVLINNAGIAYSHDTLAVSEKALLKLYQVNILSHYNTLQAFLPAMIENKKGHIVSLASMASFICPPMLGPYCGTKSAVAALWETLNQELLYLYRCPEILNSIVHPTFAATPMTEFSRDELRKAGTEILDPKVVSDAVVAQVLSGRSAQIVLAGKMGAGAASIKGWPNSLSRLLYITVGKGADRRNVGKERNGA